MVPEEVIRYISGEYSQADKAFVKQWLQENPTAREELERLQRIWDRTGELELGHDVDRAWDNLTEKMTEEGSPGKNIEAGRLPKKKGGVQVFGILMRIAAALLIAAGAYAFYQFTYSGAGNEPAERQLVYHTLISDEGEQVHFRFNDGSKVVLNSNSTVRYRSDFGKGTRELFLTGEAYFEVNQDHPDPFVVYAGNLRVKDVGTKFNIDAYSENDSFEVAVSEGEVEVSASEVPSSQQDSSIVSDQQSQFLRITQGQKVQVDRQAGQMLISDANLHAELGWLNKHLVFDEEPLRQIVTRLERYYDIEVDVLDNELLSKEVTASFENERMENVFKVLSLSLEANYNIDNNRVELYKKSTEE